MPRSSCLLAFCLVFAGAGCTGGAIDAPSLALRPVETQAILPPDEAAEPGTAADPALLKQVAAILAGAEAADRDYRTMAVREGAAIARGRNAAEGSEAWITAQEASSALEAARGAVRDAAAAIDGMRVDPANAGPGARAAIDAASTRLAAIEASEAPNPAGTSG